MSRKERSEALKQLLQLAKKTFCGDLNAVTNHGDLYDDTLSAFSEIGKENLSELSSTVYEFLDCDDHVLKEKAIATLGLSSRLHLPEFREIAYKIWLEDERPSVREVALRAWASYYSETQDPKVLKILYKILMDESGSVDFRVSAMQDIFYVSREPSKFFNPSKSSKFYKPFLTHQEFNEMIDWKEIEAIMKKYAPEVFA